MPLIPIQIKNINLLANYKFNTSNQTCLCNKSLTDTTIIDDIHEGECKHSFHKSCITQHKLLTEQCPLCKDTWNFSRNMTNTNIYLYKA